MKVLLTTLNAKYIHTNLAIRLLYQLNSPNHPDLAWREFTIKENQDAVADACAAFEVVAFSCYIWNITQTLEVAEKIKKRNPDTKILLGGPEVSYEWQPIIDNPNIDFIIIGEGETPFQSFLENFPDFKAVPSLVWKMNDLAIQNIAAPMFDIQELQKIMPYAGDEPTSLRNKVLYLETSRGCPYKCEFCLASLDNKVRYLPNENIKKTLLFLMQNGRVIKFLDRTFNMKRDFTLDIFQFILENHRPDNVFQFEITADILHPDIIKFIQENVPKNLFRFEIGIQTVNQQANLAVSRKQNFDKTKHIILQLQDYVEMHLDLIVGLALDRFDDIRYSFEQVFALYPPELQLGFLKFLKGTPVRDKSEEHGFVYDPNPPYQIIESNYLSRQELHHIELLEHALEIYWNKPRAPRTLRYAAEQYSSFDFLMQLGAFFSERQSVVFHSLRDIYAILRDFILENYPNDPILLQLAAIDYFSNQKTKPEKLFDFAQDFTPEQGQFLKNNEKLRYLSMPISVDFEILETQKIVQNSKSELIFGYDGRTKPQIFVIAPSISVV